MIRNSVSATDSKVAVLVPAAGCGERMGGQRKQFRLLGGETLLAQTVRLFDRHPGVHHIVVAAPLDEVEQLPSYLSGAGISKLYRVVPGGRTRQESVAAALEAVPNGVDLVLVHDAVRPFVPTDRIDAVIEAVRTFGAAALAVKVTDTLRRCADSIFGDTVSRQGLYRMQTPQGFRKDWFLEAHRAARQEGFEETDDVALVQRLGKSVRIVEGSAANMKVTTPEDWKLAQALWHHLSIES